jgi:8-oxo-dGTP diphosphatase
MSNQNQINEFRYLTRWNPLEKSLGIPKIQVVTSFLQKGNKVLVLQRARKDLQHKLWGIPGGKLEKGEHPLSGLIREVHEETKIKIESNRSQLLGTALSCTPCDGQYGLYIYHTVVSEDCDIIINLDEHYEFRWVTLTEFQSLDLLTAQREAFILVKDSLEILIQESEKFSGMLSC